MPQKFYALTSPIPLNVPASKTFDDSGRIEHIEFLRTVKEKELETLAHNAAYNMNATQKTLFLFTTKEEALKYAKESQLWSKERYEDYEPLYQHAVVEIIINSELKIPKTPSPATRGRITELKDLIKEPESGLIAHNITAEINKNSHLGLPYYSVNKWRRHELDSKPESKNARYTIYELANKPETYVMSQIFINENHVLDLNFQAPKTYTDFFKTDNVMDGIKAIFHDYHSPGLFSIHPGRHHKGLAEAIDKFLKQATPEQACKHLFEVRETLLKDPSLNKEGSFIRRIEFALRKLNDEKLVKLELEAKPQSPGKRGAIN